MMKKKIFPLMAVTLLAGHHTAQADEFTLLSVATANGEATTLQIEDISRLTFTDTQLVVWMNDGTQQNFSLDTFSQMALAGGSAGIHAAASGEGGIRIDGGVLTVSCQQPGTLRIYNIGGKLEASFQLSQGDNQLALPQLTKGVYLIQTPSNQVKKTKIP